jgi:hypothetical protein
VLWCLPENPRVSVITRSPRALVLTRSPRASVFHEHAPPLSIGALHWPPRRVPTRESLFQLPPVDTWIGWPPALSTPLCRRRAPRPRTHGPVISKAAGRQREGTARLPVLKLRRGYQCSGIGRGRWPSCWPSHRRTQRIEDSYPTIFLSPLRREKKSAYLSS